MKTSLLIRSVCVSAWLFSGLLIAQQQPDQTEAGAVAITEQKVPPTDFLYSRHSIEAIEDVNRIEWVHGPKMQKRAAALGITPAGPIEYQVVTGGEPMYVDVAIPVDEIPAAPGDDLYKTTQPFHCLSLVYTGSPIDASEQWQVLMDELAARALRWSGENRERIINREGFDSSKHVTELQVGIASD